jgi:hypothetical protein
MIQERLTFTFAATGHTAVTDYLEKCHGVTQTVMVTIPAITVTTVTFTIKYYTSDGVCIWTQSGLAHDQVINYPYEYPVSCGAYITVDPDGDVGASLCTVYIDVSSVKK